MNVKVIGKEGISARVIARSVNETNHSEVVTYELEYPRFIHSELMTHRVFSRNAASSRAIPVITKIAMVWNNPAMPVYWGKNQPGMQAKVELTGFRLKLARFTWKATSKIACCFAYILTKLQVHKQIANRILEPWERYKSIVSATEWDNFFMLRSHSDAQPEIQELAMAMIAACQRSKQIPLIPGEWHVPYYMDGYWKPSTDKPSVDEHGYTLDDALHISASCCAQVSYRKNDTSMEKATAIYKRLIESRPMHASPFEHQATPMRPFQPGVLAVGQTATLINGFRSSGNFVEWIQYRQLIG